MKKTSNTHQAGIFKVEIGTPLGPIKSNVTVDTGPMRLAELVPSAIELTNILMQRAEKKQKDQGKTVSCKAGCGACCRQMVPLSVPEAFFVFDLLNSIQNQVFVERFNQIAKQLEAQHVIDLFLSESFDDDKVYALATDYFSWQIPCPFLINESCAIHSFRPVACREYSVTSAPQFCTNPFSGKVNKIPMPISLSMPLARLTADLTSLDIKLIPLSLVPLWVQKHKPINQQTWPGLELFKAFIEHIGSAHPSNEINT
jgi:Fe-S-cluster containining protein